MLLLVKMRRNPDGGAWARRLQRDSSVENSWKVFRSLSAADGLHMEGHFHQLPDTYGGISGKEVRCCLQHAAIFAYKSASNDFKT